MTTQSQTPIVLQPRPQASAPRDVRRDPFARTTLRAQRVAIRAGACDWCGGSRDDGKLLRYSTVGDGLNARPVEHEGLFCSKSCHDSFHS